jgi:hypothetical protein
MSPTSPRIVQNGDNPLCFGETCEAIVLAPSSGATIIDSTLRRDLTSGIVLIAEDADLVMVSDYLSSDIEPGATFFKFGFGSDSENGGLEQCVPNGGCAFVENGEPQLVATVTWSDGTIDSIYVRSDAEPVPVPEPTSLVLLGGGLLSFRFRR